MILLCGKTCSGKDSIRAEIIKLGIQPVVTYTTRPKREREFDGKTYHFISQDRFKELEENNFFVETTSYNVATGETWYYGTSLDSISEDRVLIVNPDGLKALVKHTEFKPIVFYIYADEPVIWNRLRQRGDDADEARRRLEADNNDFKNVLDYADFAIKNDGYKSVEEIADIIVDIYNKSIMQMQNKEVTENEE